MASFPLLQYFWVTRLPSKCQLGVVVHTRSSSSQDELKSFKPCSEGGCFDSRIPVSPNPCLSTSQNFPYLFTPLFASLQDCSRLHVVSVGVLEPHKPWGWSICTVIPPNEGTIYRTLRLQRKAFKLAASRSLNPQTPISSSPESLPNFAVGRGYSLQNSG